MALQTALPGKPRLSRALVWLLLFLAFTAVAFLLFEYRYLDDLSRGRAGAWKMRALEEGTGVYTFFLLLPALIAVANRYLFRPMGWWQRGGWHVGCAFVFSLAHTSLMALSRHLLSPLLGLGPYSYGIMRYRYPMEFSNHLVIYTLVVGIYYYFRRFQMAQAHQLAVAELEAKLAQAQLENLRLQIQPHFLFNTLNTISSVMYEDVKAADRMITQLSDLLRLTLQASQAHEIRLAEEVAIARLYLNLMQSRYEEKLRVRYSVATDLEDSLVPQLILQPLLENSLRHGMKPGEGTMDLSVAAHREYGSLVLRVSDNGAGFPGDDAAAAMGRGLGLANIRNRLVKLYGDEQAFLIGNRADGGAEITLRVPFRKALPS